jgi:hypothetical protein
VERKVVDFAPGSVRLEELAVGIAHSLGNRAGKVPAERRVSMKRFCAKGHWGLVVLVVLGAAAPCAWAGANYSSVIINDAPIGYWRLGEAATATIAADASGNGRDGVYTRGVVSGVAGAINGDADTAASFDKGTAWIDVPVTGSGDWPFNLSNSFTLEAWVINAGQGGTSRSPLGRIVSNGNPGNIGFGWGILAGNGVRFTTYGVKDYDSSQAIVPQDSTWHYVAVVFDSTNTANFYVDGNLVDVITGPGPVRSAAQFDLMIGRNPTNPAEEFFNGSIDEVAVYNYELPDTQIAAHYAAGL